jgi:hypothetical protein
MATLTLSAAKAIADLQTEEFPPHVASYGVAGRLAWLDSPEAARTLKPKTRRRLRVPLLVLERAGDDTDATAAELARAVVGLLEWCGSEWWAMECRAYLVSRGTLTTSTADNRFHLDAAAFYPLRSPRDGSRLAGVCPECGHVTPNIYCGSGGACFDCIEAASAVRAARYEI